MTGDAAGRTRPVAARSGGWGERSLLRSPALFALFLGLPVATLVVAIDPRWLAAGRARLAGSPRCAVAEPRHDGDQPGRHGRARVAARVRAGPPALPGKGLVEAVVDLPIVLPPSVAGLALLLVFGRRGLLSAPFDVPRHRGAVHDHRGRHGHDLRVGAVLHPIRSDRDRRRGSRPRGRRPGGRRLGAPAVPIDHGPAGRRRAGGRAGDDLGAVAGRVRGDDHVRGQRPGPDADPAARRLLASSRAATWTRRSPRRRSWSSPPSASSSRSACFHWGGVLDVRGIA